MILQIPLRLRVQWQAALRAAGVDPRIDPLVPRAKVDSNHDAVRCLSPLRRPVEKY